MGGQVNTWKLDLNPNNGMYLVYKRQASHPMHLTIHTGKLYMYVTEGVKSYYFVIDRCDLMTCIYHRIEFGPYRDIAN